MGIARGKINEDESIITFHKVFLKNVFEDEEKKVNTAALAKRVAVLVNEVLYEVDRIRLKYVLIEKQIPFLPNSFSLAPCNNGRIEAALHAAFEAKV